MTRGEALVFGLGQSVIETAASRILYGIQKAFHSTLDALLCGYRKSRNPFPVVNSKPQSDVVSDPAEAPGKVERLTCLKRIKRFLEQSRHFALKAGALATDQYSPVSFRGHVLTECRETSARRVNFERKLRIPATLVVQSDFLPVGVEMGNAAVKTEIFHFRSKRTERQFAMFGPGETDFQRPIPTAISFQLMNEEVRIAVGPEMTTIGQVSSGNQYATGNFGQSQAKVRLGKPETQEIRAL